MKVVDKLLGFLRNKNNSNKGVLTVFPIGTVVHYRGVPCELLQDTSYYSETFKPATLWQHEETGRLTWCVEKPHRHYAVPEDAMPEISHKSARPDPEA